MKPRRYLGIRAKIILSTILCVVAVGLVSNSYLFQYMQNIISEKSANIDRLYADTVTAQAENRLQQAKNLAYFCSNVEELSQALLNGGHADALRAQEAMNAYLRTSNMEQYVKKLLVFNDRGLVIHAMTIDPGGPFDWQRVQDSAQMADWRSGQWRSFQRLYPSVGPGEKDCFVLLSPVYVPSISQQAGYMYAELDPALITALPVPQDQRNHLFFETAAGDRLVDNESLLAALDTAESDGHFIYNGAQFSRETYPLASGALMLVSCVNQSALTASNQDVMFSFATVAVMIVLIAAIVLILLTRYITDPIRRLMDKINRIALNDYTFTPALETPRNEMGEIGARLNELGLGFQQLLTETIALHDQRKEIEMAMLQSQVNPHFLYNTLNSIHWMAVVQKNPGIVSITQSLVKLLQNLSKGVSAKIPLSEDLSLLNDYINIQSIRYIETFEYVCKVPEELLDYQIVKFTLQPIVENAIFHGVVPKGTCGTITLDGYEDGDFLVLTVTDDGLGMTPEERAALLRSENRIDKAAMSGIGVANVNQRLKLSYGPEAGLSVKSEKGVYTTVSVRIRKEK